MHHYQPLSRVMWDLLHAQYFLPVGTLSERLEKGGKVVPEDTEVAVEALDASCLVKPTVPELTGAKGQNQDCTTGQCGSHSRRRHPVSGCVVLHVWFCAVWPKISFSPTYCDFLTRINSTKCLPSLIWLRGTISLLIVFFLRMFCYNYFHKIIISYIFITLIRY